MEQINTEEVLRYLGCRPGMAPDKETMELIGRASAAVLAAATVRAVSARFPLMGEYGLAEQGGLLAGKDIFAHLRGCYAAMLMALTLGDGVDQALRAAQGQSTLYQTVMDCCASVAVEQACDLYEVELRRQCETGGEYLTGRFSPGYGDFPIEKQQSMQRLLDTRRRIGLGVTESSILIPRKSVTALLGISDRPVTGKLAGCGNCALREKCSYRKEGTTCV